MYRKEISLLLLFPSLIGEAVKGSFSSCRIFPDGLVAICCVESERRWLGMRPASPWTRLNQLTSGHTPWPPTRCLDRELQLCADVAKWLTLNCPISASGMFFPPCTLLRYHLLSISYATVFGGFLTLLDFSITTAIGQHTAFHISVPQGLEPNRLTDCPEYVA